MSDPTSDDLEAAMWAQVQDVRGDYVRVVNAVRVAREFAAAAVGERDRRHATLMKESDERINSQIEWDEVHSIW